jgi:uncharacterized protein YndB with AHSA1/START domain
MSKFVYAIYVRTTAEKLWDALTSPEFTRSYWCGTWHECSWEPGSQWRLMIPDGRVGDSGEVVAIGGRAVSCFYGATNSCRSSGTKVIRARPSRSNRSAIP